MAVQLHITILIKPFSGFKIAIWIDKMEFKVMCYLLSELRFKIICRSECRRITTMA